MDPKSKAANKKLVSPRFLYLTASETAVLLSVTPHTVYNWAREGKFDGAQRFGRSWRIPKKSVEPMIELAQK